MSQTQVQVGGNRAGKKTRQQQEFSASVTRLVRDSAKEGCGVTVTQAAGWTTATADPEVPAGKIRFIRF